MKKLIFFALIWSSLGVTFATVGGPTLIGNFYYDQGADSIRYSKTFYDGLGGSEIHKYGIGEQKDHIILNVEKLEFEEGRLMSETTGLEEYFKKNKFIPLKEFQLNKIPVNISLTLKYFNELTNNESFEISKVKPHPIVEDSDGYMMSGYVFNFIWDNKITIGNQLKSQIEISTCRLDPINYRGFGLEDLDTMIIIASSAKRDCMEGGYIGEELHIITGVQVNKEYFLPQKSILLNTTNRTLQPSTGGLWIQPNMEGENIVSGTSIKEVQTNELGLWETIKNRFQKIISYISK